MVDMVVLSQIATGAFALLAVASTRIAVKYKQEIEQELAIAGAIQGRLLPQGVPQLVTKLKDLALYSLEKIQVLATEVKKSRDATSPGGSTVTPEEMKNFYYLTTSILESEEVKEILSEYGVSK